MAPKLEEASASFDFGGSTCITVTVNKKLLKGSVSPHVMAQASPVWNKFLFPPFKKLEESNNPESQPTNNEKMIPKDCRHINAEPVGELDFTEDPAEALKILLSIVHFKFNNVPTTLDSIILWQIAMLCDQYDCVHLVKPWLSGWLATEDSVCQLQMQPENWLFIAWVFGRKKVFQDVANSLVLNMRTFSHGKCLAMYPILDAPLCPMPPNILENILRLRKALITRLLEIPKKCSQEYRDKLKPPQFPLIYPEQEPKKVLCKHGNQACDAITYGSVLCGLEMIGVNTAIDSDSVDMSVNELANKLSNLTIHVFPDQTHYNTSIYNRCFPTNIRHEVAQVLKDIENPVLDSHLRHLSVQAAKLN